LQQRSRGGVLRSVAVDEKRDGYIGIDDDASHVRCALAFSAQQRLLLPHPAHRA